MRISDWSSDVCSSDLAPAIEGQWIVDAQPRFSGASGHFQGYIGRFRRPAPDVVELTPQAREAERIRQLLHELRTPVNRSEERRVGKEWVRTCRSRGSPHL